MAVKILYALLAVFFGLYGLLSVTNVEVTWSRPIMGFVALLICAVCIYLVVKRAGV